MTATASLTFFCPTTVRRAAWRLYHNLGNGKFEDVTKKAGLDPSVHAIGCTAGDYDNDGFVDLVVSLAGEVLLLHNEKDGTFKNVTAAARITPGDTKGKFNLGVTLLDYDHDGDLDLFVAQYSSHPYSDLRRSGPWTGGAFQPPQLNQIWRNNGNGTFTDQSEAVGVSVPVPAFAALGSDYNNDRAVDIVLSGWYKMSTVLENPREGKFFTRSGWGTAVPTVGVTTADFDHDGWMDVGFTQISAPGISLWRNNHGKGFDPIELPKTNWIRGWGITAFDYDNDGWVDLVAVGETADGKGEVRLFRNLGPDGFKDVTADVGLDKIQLKDPRAVITGDYDGDGATDLLITQNHGPAVLLRNEGGNKNNWLRLSFKGLADNKSAIGTKVEVFAGGESPEIRNRGIFRLPGTELDRLRCRTGSSQRGRRGAHAVAFRRDPG